MSWISFKIYRRDLRFQDGVTYWREDVNLDTPIEDEEEECWQDWKRARKEVDGQEGNFWLELQPMLDHGMMATPPLLIKS